MPNKNYQAGRRLEYHIRNYYRERGWLVMRAAGSKSPFDLAAIHKLGGCPHFIQAKRITKGNERDALRLWHAFRADPPVARSDHYAQVLWVKVGRETYTYIL